MLILSVELTIRRDFHLFASLSYIIGLARNATSSSYITTNAIYGDRTAITSDKVYKSCHFSVILTGFIINTRRLLLRQNYG